MSFHQVSEHTSATVSTGRSEHSISLDEIDDDDDEYEYVLAPKGGAGGSGGRTLGGLLSGDVDDDDEFAHSTATLHLFVDEWNDTTIGKSLAKPRLAPEDRFHYSSQKKHSKHSMNQSSIASLNKSRRIASMLYESISEMLHTSHRDVGILSLDSVTKNVESLVAKGESVETQKESLASLLAEGLRDLAELENRTAAPCWGPLAHSKQAMFHKQKDHLVNLLSDVFSKIEELNKDFDESDSRSEGDICPSGTKKGTVRSSANDTDSESTSSRSTKKRQSSFHSDVSSITSRTTASLPAEKSPKNNGAMFRLPVALNSKNTKAKGSALRSKAKKNAAAAPPGPSTRTASRTTTTTAAPLIKPPQRDIALQDSFSSFCAIDTDDKTPKRPQRRGSFGGAKSDSALDLGSDGCGGAADTVDPKASAATTRQPPLATRSLDDVVAGPKAGAPRRPGGRRRTDVRAAPPQRQRSFDGEN